MPLILASDTPHECRSGSNHFDRDLPVAGMATERTHQAVGLHRAVLGSLAPDAVPHHSHEGWIAQVFPDPNLAGEEAPHVVEFRRLESKVVRRVALDDNGAAGRVPPRPP